METGMYQILNLVNNKRYIGSSKNIKQRWHFHKRDLYKNKHHSQHLQFAYNKYGLKNFEFSILEITTEELLTERENYWCNLFNTHNPDYGYNIAAIVRNGNISEEFRQSQRNKCANKQKVYMTSKDGEILNVFESATEASKVLNTTGTHIHFLMNGDVNVFNKEFLLWRGLSFTNNNIEKRKIKKIAPNKTYIYKFSTEGVLLETFESIKEASIKTGIDVRECFRKKYTPVINNCIFSKTLEFPKIIEKEIKHSSIYQYTLDKKLIKEYKSMQELVKETGFSSKCIYKVLTNKRKSHQDFFWSRELL
jgi:group I intron endonuclease